MDYSIGFGYQIFCCHFVVGDIRNYNAENGDCQLEFTENE